MNTYLDRLSDGGGKFDPYFVPDDWARLEYGRLLWKNATMRLRMLTHWEDARHPWHDRFVGDRRRRVEELLASTSGDDDGLDERFRRQGASLRAVVRDIPPVFGSFF